jgi:hypothetical protein
MELPDHHPGVTEGSRCAILHGLLKKAVEQLATSRLARQAKSLLVPLEEISQDPTLEQGGPGWAFFRAADFFASYRVHTRLESVSIASHFLLSPFLADGLIPEELFVLGLSTKHLRLFEYSHGECHQATLPETVPPNLDAAGQFDRSERNLENRSSAGFSVGDLHRVRFGTATDRETEDAYLHDFFVRIDRGLKTLLAGRPLLLMGIQKHMTAYREAAIDGNALFVGDPGNIESLSPSEVASRVRETLQEDYYKRGDAVFVKLREMRDRERVTTDLRATLDAAAQGRVHQLCVRAETELYGSSGVDRVDASEEDLVNATVAETLRHTGEVFVVAQDRLPATQPVAAILRY